MKKIKLLLGGVAASVLLLVGFAGLANAHSFRTGTNITIGNSEKIQSSLFVAGNGVDVNSEVFGDVFCAGQNVTISGTIHGDVICAGQTVNVTARVDGDVRLAGQNVTLSGNVGGNATIASQSFTLSSTSRIDGDVTAGASTATFNGTVGRDMAASGETVVVAGEVGRNISGMIDNLQLASSAKIKGNVEFASNNEAKQADGAQVGGTVLRSDPPKELQQKRATTWEARFGWLIYSLLAMLAIALALILLFPRLFHSVTNTAIPTPWKALLTGFVANLAMPAILVVIAITVVGIPLAFVLGLAWLLVLLLSGPVFGYYLGRLLLQTSRQPLYIMLVGASLLAVLYFIPIIGILALLAALWLGSGMILLELFDKTPRPVYSVETRSSTTTTKSKKS